MTKRFELKWTDTGEVLHDNETGLDKGIYSPDYRFHVKDMMNDLHDENQELRQDNDIKFWKHQFMNQYNQTQLIMHELSLAIDNGYEVSDKFKEWLDNLAEKNKEVMAKHERLFE